MFQFQTDHVLYSGDSSGTVHIWDMKIRRVSSTFKAHPGHSVLWMDFTQTGALLTQGREGWVKIWNQSDSGWEESGKEIILLAASYVNGLIHNCTCTS